MQKLPEDEMGFRIPVLSFKPNSAKKQTLIAASVRFGPFDKNTILTICSSSSMNFELGGSSVTADGTKHFLPAAMPYDINMKDQGYISVYGTGDVYLSERV